MNLTLLGTGNAAGMPLYGCDCKYCKQASENKKLHRTPCSAMLEIGTKRYLIDAGQVDIHQRFPAGTIDGIVLTHFHPDHIQGLFHLRWGVNQSIPVYSPPDSEGCADLYKHPGILDFKPQKKFQPFELAGIKVTPLPLIHSKPTFGYLFEGNNKRIAYLTDTKGLPPATQETLSVLDLDIMIIDCSFAPGVDKKGHNNLVEVIAIAAEIKPKSVVLTHIGHDFDIWLKENPQNLPANFIIGQDGLDKFQVDHV